MDPQIPLSSRVLAVDSNSDAQRDDGTHEVAPASPYRRLAFVNVVFLGKRGAADGRWLLVDCGVPGARSFIKSAAAARSGATRPRQSS